MPTNDGRIVFLDTEFTTLSKTDRKVWEVALIVRDPGQPDVEYEWQVRPDLADASPDALRVGSYYRRCHIADRPPGTALLVTAPGYEELPTLVERPLLRRPADSTKGMFEDVQDRPSLTGRITTAADVAFQVARMVADATMVAMIPSADEVALDLFMAEHNQVLAPHYRLRCVETLTLGYLLGRNAERGELLGGDKVTALPPAPWDPKELSRLVGVPVPGDKVAHRALVDTRWERDLWDVVFAAPGQD